MGTLQDELLRAGEVTQGQYNQQMKTFERAERIKQQKQALRRNVTVVAERLNLNNMFINEFSKKRNQRTVRVLKELGKRRPKGTDTKCVYCKAEGIHHNPARQEQMTKGQLVLYKRFNLCTNCFPPDKYGASLNMGG